MSTLLFLHGAIGSSNQLSKIFNRFENSLTFNFPGHGKTKLPAEFSIELFSQAVIDFLDKKELKKFGVADRHHNKPGCSNGEKQQ
jgi:pimeloyl-ACP methyl ester carboxylesterase